MRQERKIRLLHVSHHLGPETLAHSAVIDNKPKVEGPVAVVSNLRLKVCDLPEFHAGVSQVSVRDIPKSVLLADVLILS
jgi:hypothetical protein